MSIACSTVCFTVLKSGLVREGYWFINCMYSGGIFFCALSLFSGLTDLMAFTWNNAQSELEDEMLVGRATGGERGAWSTGYVVEGRGGDGIGDTFAVEIDATLWILGIDPLGTLMNCRIPLVCALVSYM